jgi:hypothetical protein
MCPVLDAPGVAEVHDVSVRPVTSSRDEVGGIDRKDTAFAVEIPRDFLHIYHAQNRGRKYDLEGSGTGNPRVRIGRDEGRWQRRINYRGGKEATAYYTTDDDDAMGMATAMVVARGQQ